MAILLSDIRFTIQRELQDSTIDNETVIIWCNNASSDFGIKLNIPTTSTIAVITTDLSYALPTNLKIINRLSFQSDIDNGVDKEFQGPYRIYNGQIIFPSYFTQAETLNVDYYKQMTYFTAITDAIDIDDRYNTIYTSFCKMQYYDLPSTIERLGVQVATRKYQDAQVAYNNMKNTVTQQYALKNEPTTINSRW